MSVPPLKKIAEDSPGLATAAAQRGISKNEQKQLAAFLDLKKTHEFLVTLPQNDAYKNYNALTPQYQKALKDFFDPKYTIQDKGFIGNIARSLGSSAHYAVQSFKELGMQIAGLPVTPTTGANPAEALLTLGTGAPVAVNKETGVSTGAGRVLESLVRPQEKLIKQPYAAERLAEEEGKGSLLGYGKFVLEGAKELLPGGTDAAVGDKSADWKQFWEQASDKENVFDRSEVDKINSTLEPEVAYVGKLLAGRKNFIEVYDELLADPKKLALVQLYTAGDKDAMKKVGDAVARFEKAKISPGRDVARALISAFPFEAEKAMMGDGPSKAFFASVSGAIDFGVTFGLDPLILAGKAKRASDVARFGLMKLGADPVNLEKAWQNASVRRYWDNLGGLFTQYNNGDLATKGAILTRIAERFPEISPDVAMYMAPNIKNADDALEFFRGGDIIDDISKGNAGLRRDPLIPRYTIGRGIRDSIRDGAVRGIEKMAGKYQAADLPSDVVEIARIADENPVGWSETIGFQEAADVNGLRKVAAGRKEGKRFVSKDASTAAKIDRVFRQFSIAPSQERLISLTDASSADQVYRLMRTVLDKASASTLRAAWIAANEGQRLLMYKGIVKTLAHGMGLDHTSGGRKFIDEIDKMSTELYSVNQSALDLGELTNVFKSARAGNLSAPEGVRNLVREATDKATAAGLAGRVVASSGQELAVIIQNVKDLKALKKDLLAKAKVSQSEEEIATINSVVNEIDSSLKILGGSMGKLKVSRDKVKKMIDNLDPIDPDVYNAAELNGAQRAIRSYQLSQSRYMPNLVELRQFELRGNVFSSLTGLVGESALNQKTTDIWSYLNLYPRLGLRTTVEELGTAGLMGGAEGIANIVKGFALSQNIRKASGATTKVSAFKKKEKEVSPLGVISRQIYKVLRTDYSPEQIAAMADDVELFAQNVGKSMAKSRFKPEFLQTAKGQRIGGYAEDWVRNNGQETMNTINGAVRNSEIKVDIAEETASTLKQYGPSVQLNVNVQEALKDAKFARVFSQIEYNRPEFLMSWYMDLQNSVGPRNIFGQIVFSNILRKEEDVIDALVKYIDGKGNDLAKRFAIYNAKGSRGFAEAIYADSTVVLRDFSGRLNKQLIEEIKASGGVTGFDFQQLAKYEENFQHPKSVLGRELIPLQQGDAASWIDRAMKNGYGWVGKQIAMLDREPITYGNYLMYREDLVKYQSNLKNSFLTAGIDDATADLLARNQAHEVATSFARQRTLGYVDNSDVRTNLAFNLRNFGRYYRATEDFYRRLARLGKYEKRAVVRLAVLNQTFEHSGFIHKDANGEMYFTYPGDDVLNWAMGNTVFRLLGIPGAQPMSVNFGGKLKMLTPSLDPESAAPRLGGPFIGISLAILENIPGIGNWLKSAEPTITGGMPDQEWWRKFTPINVQRLIDMGIRNDKVMMTEQKFSATVQAMRLLVSTGNGPKEGSDINKFSTDLLVQATNIMALRFVTGLGAPASVQMFANKDVPKELIDAGVFSWDSEFAKFLQRHAGEDQAFSKALVEFTTLYPSKSVYSVSKTSSNTEAGFQKTYEAANFVRNNADLVKNHKQAAAFFIPISGTADLESYSYLKAQGFVKNKQLEDFLREASTAEARQKYNARKDYYEKAIAENPNSGARREYRNLWSAEQQFFKNTYPLLAKQLESNEGYIALKNEALSDLRKVVYSGMAPDKQLANVFGAMILQYESGQEQLNQVQGRTAYDNGYKKAVKEDLREVLLQLAGTNPNALSAYWNLFDPLIGE